MRLLYPVVFIKIAILNLAKMLIYAILCALCNRYTPLYMRFHVKQIDTYGQQVRDHQVESICLKSCCIELLAQIERQFFNFTNQFTKRIFI